MKLGKKLTLMSVTTILVPMLIVIFFAVLTIFRNTTISQWEYLENIQDHVHEELIQTEVEYRKSIMRAAEDSTIKAKLYFYEKYWDSLSDSLRNYDLGSLTSLLENLSYRDNLKLIAAYRRDGDVFKLVDHYGQAKFLPGSIDKKSVEGTYNKAVYHAGFDGLYLKIHYPVFSDGKLVGLLLYMRAYDSLYMKKLTGTYNVRASVVTGSRFLLGSDPKMDGEIKKLLENSQTATRRSFRLGGKSWTALIHPFTLSPGIPGSLILYTERTNALSENRGMLFQLLFLALLCVLIPVAAFSIKEVRLIASINELLSATTDVSAGNYRT